jgi:hypothetical protein
MTRKTMRVETKLLVEPPKPGRSKVRGQTKRSLWSCRLGVGRVANEFNSDQYPHSVVAQVKKEDSVSVKN